MVKQITPILVVEAIEPCLPFWTERLGFQLVASVPHGDTLGFAMLVRDGAQVMYQSVASMEEDLQARGQEREQWRSLLYIDVDDIQSLLPKLAGCEVYAPLRKTFYGATEIFVREPGGSVVGFAEHDSKP